MTSLCPYCEGIRLHPKTEVNHTEVPIYSISVCRARLDWEKLLESITLSSEKLGVKQKAMDDFHSSPFKRKGYIPLVKVRQTPLNSVISCPDPSSDGM